MPPLTVDFQPLGRRTQIERGATLLQAAQDAGAELLATCGGQGTCGDCRIRIAYGTVSPLTPEEQTALTPTEQATGWRLACQCVPLSDVKIEIPPTSLSTPQRLSIEGQAEEIQLDPPITATEINITPPCLTDLRADSTRLLETLQRPNLHLSRHLLTHLSEHLRRQHWQACLALRKDQIIAVLPPGSPLLGLAVDIGTTKVAAYLVNLQTGHTLAKTGAMNPQIAYGEDVISRIHYANTHPNGRHILQHRIIESINQLIQELTAHAQIRAETIVEAVIVGNTVMHHLFAGLPVEQLGTSPYLPAVAEPLEFPAAEIGLAIAPAAYIYLPPNIAGYVGADHVAMALAAEIHHTTRRVLAVDIGTNTEISLAANGRLRCCSCASGPAFEGAHITFGMRAAPGAIEKVRIGETIQIATIEHRPPVGICGSGLLDAVAELTRVGALEKRGNFNPQHPLVQTRQGKRQIILSPAEANPHKQDISLLRTDINQIQLAKAAIRTGIDILLTEAGLHPTDLDEFILAGAFGTYLDIASAIRIGMFPPLPREKFRQIGNAAGAGARQMLLSHNRRRQALDFARHSEYIELSTHQDFQTKFTQNLLLG
ncbi:MAG: ferredoxin [Anaerolineae bacterium]|nr:MAG: ferredoxin [Anaerolineae bacterium]